MAVLILRNPKFLGGPQSAGRGLLLPPNVIGKGPIVPGRFSALLVAVTFAAAGACSESPEGGPESGDAARGGSIPGTGGAAPSGSGGAAPSSSGGGVTATGGTGAGGAAVGGSAVSGAAAGGADGLAGSAATGPGEGGSASGGSAVSGAGGQGGAVGGSGENGGAAAGVPCEDETCNANQYCRVGCLGTGGGSSGRSCAPLPATCDGVATCDCVCGGPRFCTDSGGAIRCGCS